MPEVVTNNCLATLLKTFLTMLVFISLQKYVTLQMESMAYIHHSSPLAGSEFSSVGKLILQQSGPLPHKGIHKVYDVIINENFANYNYHICLIQVKVIC